MGSASDNKEQWQKIKDVEYAGIIVTGLAFTTEAIETGSSYGFALLAVGIFLIVIGWIQVRAWQEYFEHRIKLAKWVSLLLMVLIVIQGVLFYLSTQPFLYKSTIFGVNLLIEIALIAFFLRRKAEIENRK